MNLSKKTTTITILLVVMTLATGLNAAAKKIYLNKMPDNGIWINGSSFAYQPGDTLVLRSSTGPYSYLDMTGFNGTATKPLYIINEGGQVHISLMRFKDCNYVKILGNGSADQYGFFMTSSNTNAPAVGVSGRSSNFEVARIDVNNHGYGFWVKEEGNCDPAYQYPNWVMDNFSLHDNRIRNTYSSGFYLGSTDPNGTRPYTCNGQTTYPLPLRLGNIKVYNNILDHTGRGGIQLSSASYGTNEIYNNNISYVGQQLDGQQGNGIVLGGYTSANIYNNNINYTLASGIYSLGAGLVKIENNTVNNSGNLNGHTTTFAASVFVDTRPTMPATPTSFVIKNNTLGSHTGEKHIRVHKSYDTYTTNNIICGNQAISGSLATHVDMGITWTACAPNLAPIVSAGPNLNIVLPANSANMQGSASDADGFIASYKWTQVSGPSQANIAYPGSPPTMIYNLVQGTYVFRLTVVDNQNTTSFADATVIVSTTPVTQPLPAPPPPPPTTTDPVSTVSLKIEAENYSNMAGIQTEPTSDAGGGSNVGWQDNNDWMDYAVNIPAAGTYTVKFRVASYFTGAQFQLRNNAGNVLATVTVPNTGSFQSWTTVEAQATLPAGQQTLRLFTSNANGGWNINWWEISGTASTTTPSNQAPVASAGNNQTITLPVNSLTLTGSGTDADGSIASYAWTKISGPSGESIASPAQAQTTVSNLVQGTYIFRLTVKDNAGATATADVTITVNAAPATTPAPSTVSIKIEAENYSNMAGIQTEPTSDAGGGSNVGWQDNNDWMDYAVNIPAAGTYTVKFRVASYFTGAQFQLRNNAGNVLATVTVPNTGSFQSWTTVEAQATLPAGQQTLRLFTSNANGGWNINWWEISGTASTTTPSNQAPVASAGNNQTITLPVNSLTLTGSGTDADGSIASYAWTKISGPSGESIASPAQAQTTVSNLVQGTYIFRLTVKDNAGATATADVTITVNAAPATTPAPVSIKIEAEHYSKMAGIQTEPTSDAGGGLNVGWQDNNDWMDYAVNVSSSGTYTVNFRVASYFTGAQFQLRNSGGTSLATVTVPKTGTFQTWTTVSAQVNLAAGQQTLKIITTAANGGWNINWFELAPQAVATMSVNSTEQTEAVAEPVTGTMEIFPNPVSDKFVLQVNNDKTGALKVQMFNLQGSVVREFSLNKSSTGSAQFYLSIGDLPTGQYILKATMKDWTMSSQLVKQ